MTSLDFQNRLLAFCHEIAQIVISKSPRSYAGGPRLRPGSGSVAVAAVGLGLGLHPGCGVVDGMKEIGGSLGLIMTASPPQDETQDSYQHQSWHMDHTWSGI